MILIYTFFITIIINAFNLISLTKSVSTAAVPKHIKTPSRQRCNYSSVVLCFATRRSQPAMLLMLYKRGTKSMTWGAWFIAGVSMLDNTDRGTGDWRENSLLHTLFIIIIIINSDILIYCFLWHLFNITAFYKVVWMILYVFVLFFHTISIIVTSLLQNKGIISVFYQ